MPQATLINSAGQKVVVDSGSQQAQNYFGQGYQLMGANGQYQAPQQPSLPQGAPQGSQAINGAQYNTQALQQANFSQITPIGNTLYGVPNVASSLTSSQLTGGTPNVPAATTNNQTSPDATMAGANEYMNQLNQQNEAEAQRVTDTENRLATTQNSYNDLMTQIGQKGTEYKSELDKYNYTANVNQLNEINAQIKSLTAAYNTRITDNQGRPILNAIIGGQESLLRRQQAAEVGELTAISQALQGSITMAEKTAKNAIDVKYEPMENQLKQQLQQIDFLYNDLSRADQKKADSQTALLNERLRVIEEQKTVENNISNIVLTAAQKGADMNTLNSIRNAKTLDEAILVASGATPILTPAGLAGLTENDIMRVGNKIYKKGKNWLAPEEEVGDMTPQKIGTDANGQDLFYDPATNTVKTANEISSGANVAQGIVATSTGETYDIKSYATDPTHEAKIQSILNNVGQLKSIADIDNYISSVVPNSPVTGQMIANSASKYGVSWEMMVAIMQQDSSFGTAGKAVRTKNPGNVGNTDSGGTQTFVSWQAGVDAVAKNLAWRKTTATQGQNIPSEVSALSELVRTGRLTEKEALDKVSKVNSTRLTEELAKISVEKIVSSYTDEMKNRTLQSVNELMGQVNPYTVGFGTLIKGVPTTAARSFASQLETLKASIAFGELTAMREASKTGGALGQVSDKEGQLLQNALGALDQGQSAEQFKAQLKKIKESIERWKAAANNYSATSGTSSVNIADLDFRIN